MKTIFRVEFGSHLYGTNTPESDHDYKSIYIPSAESILLQRVKDSGGNKIQKGEGVKNTKEDIDDDRYSLQQYLKLLSEGQTVALDMLFAPAPIEAAYLWHKIVQEKDRLITKKSAAFVGYCRQQANKYGIKGSRVSAAKKAMDFFKMRYDKNPLMKVWECFTPGVREEQLAEFTRIYTKETTPGKEETYFECVNRSVGMKNTVKEAYGIFSNIYREYGDRARKAESNEGVDWKALSHAVRVGEEALELLSTGHITFPLPNREHILQIKKGVLKYKEVSEEIESLLEKVEKASIVSKLREEPDYEWIDRFVITNYGKAVMDYVWGGF